MKDAWGIMDVDFRLNLDPSIKEITVVEQLGPDTAVVYCKTVAFVSNNIILFI